ncbi:MAG TPA: FxsA family protein, partial [Candidatus Lustribacter sp.]|nr:FxsA family protein [Candidatus Lustribacter sp.]
GHMAPPVGSAPRAPRARRRRWPALVFVLVLVVPVAEIAVIIGVGRVIGGWPTVVLLLVESALGAWLVRREGTRTWGALSTALRTGQMPSRQLADAALVLIGGTLLLTPGFVTDLVGFFFIVPLTRPLARAALEAFVARRLLGGIASVPGPSGSRGPQPPSAASGDVIEGEIL